MCLSLGCSFSLDGISSLSVHPVQEMVRRNRYKTLRWHFVESLEPPKVVHARCPDMVSKGNMYGQVTVRMHSRQVRKTVTNTQCHSEKGCHHFGILSRWAVKQVYNTQVGYYGIPHFETLKGDNGAMLSFSYIYRLKRSHCNSISIVVMSEQISNEWTNSLLTHSLFFLSPLPSPAPWICPTHGYIIISP